MNQCFARILAVFLIGLGSAIFLFHNYGAGHVTNLWRDDGFGAQFHAIICTAVYAELKNLNFVYSPFRIMEHNYDRDPNFLAKKEQLINFKNNFRVRQDNEKIKHITAPTAIAYFEKNLKKSYNTQALQNIKQIFRANKPSNFFNNTKFNIAVHIRRQNIQDYDPYGRTSVTDQKFLEIIDRLRQDYADKDYLIHIYSQGSPDNFKAFLRKDTVLHLNQSIEDTYTGMVLADALVLSPSALSYTAGLLSNGDVYYINGYWHPPIEHWKII